MEYSKFDIEYPMEQDLTIPFLPGSMLQVANDAKDTGLAQKVGDEKSRIEGFLSAFGISSFWHMTHRENISGILNRGILSNNVAHKTSNHRDISDHGVQLHREKLDPYYHRKIHEYTPLYFNIKNPMLYRRKDMQDELCLIEISVSCLEGLDFLFTDGNAASRDTNFYNSFDKLNSLPWDVLNSRTWFDLPDGRRKRCAEILVYPHVEPMQIKKIYCRSEDTLNSLASYNCDAVIDRTKFFM